MYGYTVVHYHLFERLSFIPLNYVSTFVETDHILIHFYTLFHSLITWSLHQENNITAILVLKWYTVINSPDLFFFGIILVIPGSLQFSLWISTKHLLWYSLRLYLIYRLYEGQLVSQNTKIHTERYLSSLYSSIALSDI